ncbi:CDP-alcohol phosphatidyltransferase family protein [Candidatus Woesearchaeota archaeon]|nr:CDP-alcohol phosphatidyltransferase family protein [Candidatus Woesearchaeota archaeon]
MFIDIIKKHISKKFKKTSVLLYNLGITPNRLTNLTFVLIFLSFYLFATKRLFLGGIAITISYLTDILDGHIARVNKKTTKLGFFLDKSSDMLRPIIWIALGIGNFVSYMVVSLVLFTIIYNFYLVNMAKLNKLKTIDWLPQGTDFLIIFGALFNQVPLTAYSIVIINIIFFLLNFITLIYFNRER